MKIYKCDDCKDILPGRDNVNTVTLNNVFSEQPVEYHYCCECAKAVFPKSAESMISWTARTP